MLTGINDKDMRKVAKQAQKEGWVITLTGNNHLKWKSPEGITLFSPLTGSYRGWKNFRAMLRRNGFDPNGGKK